MFHSAQHILGSMVVLTFMVCGLSQAQSLTKLPRGNALLGKEKADAERCMECHGEDGHGQRHPNGPEGKFAKLAGQSALYMLKQLEDFRSGARHHDQMAIMARTVADEDLADIVAYFSSQSPMKGDGQKSLPQAAQIFREGIASRGVPACVACHGPDARGVPDMPHVPFIAGQEWRYLQKQLFDWKSGDRRNGGSTGMNDALKNLTESELEVLATYLSGL